MTQKKPAKPSTTPKNTTEALHSMGTSTLDPGYVWGITGLILFFLFPIAGLPVSIMGYDRSKNAGYKNDLALIGIILNGIAVGFFALIFVITFIVIIIAAIASSSS